MYDPFIKSLDLMNIYKKKTESRTHNKIFPQVIAIYMYAARSKRIFNERIIFASGKAHVKSHWIYYISIIFGFN